ncbi:putative transcription initiation factor tfiid subunit 9 protein [Phaeoacremonium minimum UCRPA7]|uniref:Putative transcription initiation factor tfiid subunit 9 protein n=1 Tax=Phaeoacremonium minimum (strain UCR-PA7) TaxID=1286976 RepID=R8BG98_PHAM7|nr:putative transcription initiation factor tfiid subunit 9 protein [Phaeoacremonium minimum UCRPA7]EON98314.1 putative transcription initiation factor tfiid subunit 9 protein [Phaeoacremonium minimum UCRPA7]
MATTSAVPQTNGIPASSAGSNSQTVVGTQSQPQMSQGTSQQPTQTSQSQSQPPGAPTSPTAAAPRPRDQRTLELLLTAQGVTAFEARVPLLLLDFAYRHTSSVLSDALHLSADPYTSHAGSRPSATAGGTASVPASGGDATVSANAIQLAIQARLAYQFRGGGGATGGGGASKDYLQKVADERNRIALPRVAPSEWGVRLPSERFVLSGAGWGLRDVWAGQEDDSDDEEGDGDVAMEDAMEGIEGGDKQPDAEDVGGDGVEGGTMEDMFGEEMEDEVMAEE